MGEDDWLEAAYEDRHHVPDDDPDPDVEEECWHDEAREEEEVGTGRTFLVCEDCGVTLAA